MNRITRIGSTTQRELEIASHIARPWDLMKAQKDIKTAHTIQGSIWVEN